MFNASCELPGPPDGQKIFDYLFISDWDTSQNPEWLKENNIKAVFCISEHEKKPNIVEWYTENGIIHHHLKVYDSPLENLNKIEVLFPKIDDHVSKKENVLIHCMAGISRSPSVILFYRQWKGFDYATDMTTFRQVRKINPNHGFLRQLEYYSREKKFLVKIRHHHKTILLPSPSPLKG